MRNIIPLSRWYYKETFEDKYVHEFENMDGFSEVVVPHANKEIPFSNFDEKMYQFESCYKRIVEVSEEMMDKRLFLDFEGVMTYAEVFWDGNLVGSHKGGYTPFSVEITDVAKPGKHELILKVDSRERDDIPPFGFVIDYLCYGGVYREVYLRAVEKTYIKNIKVEQVGTYQGLKINTFVDTKEKGNYNLTGALWKDGVKISEETIPISVHDGVENHEIVLSGLENIKEWGIDNPELYEVKVELHKGEILDEVATRHGFRTVNFKEDGFYLNGERVKLRGLNRHQSYPYVGYAMPRRAQEKDADILKYELGINIVRTSHYPQSKHFINRCDEIGLLVFEEIPGWQHIGNEEWQDVAVENVREMIERDWNHPSIIIWGVRINESQDHHEFYSRTNALARELDSTRQTGGVRFIEDSEMLEDVYTFNDFQAGFEERRHRDQQAVTGLKKDVPFLITEFAGHMHPTKRYDPEQWRVEHANRHAYAHDEIGRDHRIAGAIGWCAFDYNTHYQFGSGDRICYHGVMDMFRLPKFASYVYSSQKDPQDEIILEPLTNWTQGDREEGGVMPLMIYTNCDSVKMYIGEKEIGEYKPSFKKFPGLKRPPIVIDEMISTWGDFWNDACFIGYIDGKEVKRRKFLKNPVPSKLHLKADDLELLANGYDESYDVTRVCVELTDEIDNITMYGFERIKFKVEGPGEIIGPDETVMLGSAIAFWVKTIGQTGVIKVQVEIPTMVSNTIDINVI